MVMASFDLMVSNKWLPYVIELYVLRFLVERYSVFFCFIYAFARVKVSRLTLSWRL